MKILIVTDAWEPQINGVVRTLRTTCTNLEAMGHNVKVISPLGFHSMPCPTYPEIRLAVATPVQLQRLIHAFNPDCLHIATEGPLGWIARGLALHRGWNFTTAYHSRFPEYVHARFRIPVSWSYALLKRFHNAGKATLAPTPSIVNELRAQGFLHAKLWSRGVELDQFRPDGPTIAKPNNPVFLYVGRIAIEKQVERFLSLNLPGEKWVVGDGPDRERLQTQFSQARWFGMMHGEELVSIYRSADVLVFPSITDTFGLVMIEAMACGTPVAAFPVIGPIDVVGTQSDGGVLNDDLGQACLDALNKSRSKVRLHAEQFSWQKATEQILAAFHPLKGQVFRNHPP